MSIMSALLGAADRRPAMRAAWIVDYRYEDV
jgi:hypothetical protein